MLVVCANGYVSECECECVQEQYIWYEHIIKIGYNKQNRLYISIWIFNLNLNVNLTIFFIATATLAIIYLDIKHIRICTTILVH